MDKVYDDLDNPAYKDFIAGEGVMLELGDKYLITQFFGLEFTGSNRPEDVHLRGCRDCTVDLQGGNSYSCDSATIEKTTFKTENNEVILDAKDRVKGTEFDDIVGPGIYHEGHDKSQLE